jgi:23S rRNA pseudouridine2457 synthase
MLIAFYKPYGVLSQFTQDDSSHRTLAEFGFPKHLYPIGRLDADSEGLLLLSDEKKLVDRLLNPQNAHHRTYHAQVEHIPTESDLVQLRKGVRIGSGKESYTALPCHAALLTPQPVVPEREPPIRVRLSIPTCWLELRLIEGKNRQVRRMTAAIHCPTLRLIRMAIGACSLNEHITLQLGQWRECTTKERALILS